MYNTMDSFTLVWINIWSSRDYWFYYVLTPFKVTFFESSKCSMKYQNIINHGEWRICDVHSILSPHWLYYTLFNFSTIPQGIHWSSIGYPRNNQRTTNDLLIPLIKEVVIPNWDLDWGEIFQYFLLCI